MTDDEEIAKKLNSAVFPGLQGGPLEHVIAAKLLLLKKHLTLAFKEYGENVIKNAAAMADVFNQHPDFRVISGGTNNHLFLVDVTKLLKMVKLHKTFLKKLILL